MARVNTGVVPPFGWRFPLHWPTVDDKWITGDSFDNLITHVTNHRASNQLPIGSPGNDIESYLCSAYPHFCHEDAGDRIEPSARETDPESTERNLRERVSAWAANRYSKVGAIELVEQEEADRRAVICASCPQNVEWKIGCPPCIESASRNLVLIRQAQNTKYSDQLKGCAIAGHDNSTAAWLPESLLKHRVQYQKELPSHCWMLELYKE